MEKFTISPAFREELENTGWLHRPLPIHAERSMETLGLGKKVLGQRVLCGMENADGWRGEGPGTVAHTGRETPAGHTSLRMECPTTGDKWPDDNPEGDYIPYFRQFALFDVGGEDWGEYNRVHFWVYPECDGAHCVNIDLMYWNDGEEKIPDAYNREGRHEVNLENGKWNECFLEIPDLPRDKITTIGFERAVFGRERSMGDTWRYDFGEITLQKVDAPETAHGWLPAPGKISYSMSGYAADGPKTALMRAGEGAPPAFTVKDEAGATAREGIATRQQTALGSFDVLDFSGLRSAGRYTLHCGGASTGPFPVGENVWGESVWKALNFVFCERCGAPVAGMHGSCHGDIIAEHGGVKLAFCGGWHDAGDLSQQTLQTGEVAFTLLEMAAQAKEDDKQLYLRLLEEAEWGVDFLLKCRFGDGYYASSAGIVHWSDGFIGNVDDRPARVQNNSFDSLLYAAIYARAAMTLTDAPLCSRLATLAEEDFAYAESVFEEKGFTEKPIQWEHSLNTSPAQYMAATSFAASMLFRLTGKEKYAQKAAKAIEYTLSCQRTKPIGEAAICGFFYRDDSHRVIQHYNHQSRDAMFMQALRELLDTQPAHADRPKWLEAVRLYGEYVKKTAAFAQPWGMLPSGVYHVAEAKDEESFTRQHLHAGATAEAEYLAQVKNGVKLDDEHYLRLFPVWLSFRGNSAVHLATGKAAAICAEILGDTALRSIALEQLYWVVGKNPFCQSLMYGEGHNYPQQAVFLPGTMAGQLPVGIETRGDEDVPYWPQANNATYKEAWLSIAGKWFSLIAELA